MHALVVDDDMATVEVIVRSVDWERFGIDRVESCYNIASAKRIFGETDIDVAICDIEMPMGSGLDLLAWVREEGFSTEFIFLTSHERFDYASTAIRYRALGYVVKPFRREQMERELWNAVEKIQRETALLESRPFVYTEFWKSLLEGHIPESLREAGEEIGRRRLSLDPAENRILVRISCGRVEEIDRTLGGEGRHRWENTFEESLREGLAVQRAEEILCLHEKERVCFAGILSADRDRDGIREALEEALEEMPGAVGYISETVPLWKVPGAWAELEEKERENVAAKGTVFFAEEVKSEKRGDGMIVDRENIRLLLQEKRAKDLLESLKFTMEHLAAKNMLDHAALVEIRQALWQAVGVYLGARGIDTAQVFGDEASVRMEERAVDSLMDMMRWQAYLIPRTLACVRDTEKSGSVVEKVKGYVRDHYRENITRAEIAECVYLNPEYMAKLFKKETGVSLRQYLSDYRIERAKELLALPDVRVSDVATEVGFESFSYFSTVFKKTTGQTPVEYSSAIISQN